MNAFTACFCQSTKAFFVAATLWSSVSICHAVAPASPVIDPKIEFTRSGFNGAGVDSSGNTHSFLVKWEDKSVDEEGFRINVSGAVVTSQLANANSRSAIVSLPGLAEKLKLSFSVTAWKYNGNTTETSNSSTVSFIIPDGLISQGTMATPTSFTVKKSTQAISSGGTQTDDGIIEFSWTDGSSAELFNQIQYKEASAAETEWSHLTFTNFSTLGTQTQLVRPGILVPSKTYQFRIRATQTTAGSGNVTFFSAVTPNLIMEPLKKPESLSAQALRENLIQLTWRDHSNNETGYEVEFNNGSGNWASAGQLEENATNVNIPVNQGSTLEWRVAALYEYKEAGSTVTTTLKSAYSNTVSFSTSFPAPTEVTATTSGFANSIDVSWKDNSNSEYGYNVYSRPVGTSTYYFARAVPAGVTKITVNSRAETFTQAPDEQNPNRIEGVPIYVPLEVGRSHEFVVRAVAQNETTVSLDSTPASSNSNRAFAKDGFTISTSPPADFMSQLHRGAESGQSFSYTVTTSNESNRASLEITGLESTGLNFNAATGLISGSPLSPGIYKLPLTATFNDGTLATVTLNLRVTGATSAPVASIGAFPPRTLGVGAILDINLADRIKDADSEMAVRMETTKGNIDILLYPSAAPKAVANFMAYVNAGDYNGLIFHRLVSDFVLQAGSLTALREPRTFASVKSRPAVENETGLRPAPWTVGAAKLGARTSFYTPATTSISINRGNPTNFQYYGYEGSPDSATTDFFINLGDNSSSLNDQSGGFTTFGRITDSSQPTVSSIKNLPRGNYTNSNTTNNYDASLDKRIIIDGYATDYRDIPMDVSGAAPIDMDINKTVRITKVTPIASMLSFTANAATSPPGIISVTLTGTTLKLRGLKDSLTPVTVTVTARDLDNKLLSIDFPVTVTKGHLAPVITKQPVTQNATIGSAATFSVTATGTNLSYSWRKNGTALNPPETGSTVTIANVQANNDLYDVVVSNATTAMVSNKVRIDTIEAAALSPDLTHQIIEVGKPLLLSTTVTGTPMPTISWKKNGIALAAVHSPQLDGSVITSYKVASATLANAGAYEVSATNSKTTPAAQSSRVNVIAVDKKTTKLQVTSATKTVSLTAPFLAPPQAIVSYTWKKDGIDVVGTDDSFTNSQSKVLTIRPIAPKTFTANTHTGRYTCVITLPDNLGTVETGAVELTVVTKPYMPALLKDNDALPDGFIGVSYTATLPYSKLALHTPSSFSFSGSIPGLTFNTTTGILSGVPTKAGIYAFSASAKNLDGSNPASTGQIIISPLPAANIGSLTATISASQALNGNMGGRLDLTTLDTGAFTAKVTLGKVVLSAAGRLSAGTGLYNPNTATFQSRVTIPRKGLSPLNLVFEIDSNGGYLAGSINDGDTSANISGIRQFWSSIWNPCPYFTAKSRFINLGLNLTIPGGSGPQGNGYMSLSLSSAGKATFAGRLPDGEIITGSSLIGPNGESLFFNLLYAGSGALLTNLDVGEYNFGTPAEPILRTTGQSRWIKLPQPATARTYQSGIAETFLKLEGTHYYPPTSGKIIMGVADVPTSQTNLRMKFDQGGLNPPVTADPDIAFRLATNHVASYPIARTEANTFAVTTATGFYSGTFTLRPTLQTLVDARKVTYQGMIIPRIPFTPVGGYENGQQITVEIPGSNAYGSGYFLMPELTPTVTTSKINSGKASLLAPTFVISTQPSPAIQAVSPGTATVSYNVAITPSVSGITYRWRKNKIEISGATTATLTLSNITESNQGSYDCVISNGPVTVISTSAVLNVNDPVSAVSASRSPSGSILTVGTKVTFTASAQGTDLIYQWRKNGINILNQTGSTLELSSAVTGDTSTYDVLVSNSVTPGGIASNSVALTVQ
jgi:cyclophilin family peptidyl-prolyl cis-trans isomerase